MMLAVKMSNHFNKSLTYYLGIVVVNSMQLLLFALQKWNPIRSGETRAHISPFEHSNEPRMKLNPSIDRLQQHPLYFIG